MGYFYSFPPANGSGNNDTERDIMQLQSMLLYTAMMAYIRIANTVKNVSFYFYNFSITNNKFNSFKTKSLNALVNLIITIIISQIIRNFLKL